ncbi:hypothetical protein SAMN06265379_101717 [Saccharicrinis carchari]|uniref:Uncharacterized protein n=1 Tax=Saccharicrinis carchari TaxID=1168039 RepID=A0A521B5B5_SACCC|nr:hypothetical protein [Saccharicrinis carchari]SMO42269.1 hypothetical protein SAMN06265379_101717 [Saccharicrinis carchari]
MKHYILSQADGLFIFLFKIIASFNIIQASLILSSLIAIIAYSSKNETKNAAADMKKLKISALH